MSRIPKTKNSEIFTMRLTPKLKKKLNLLAQKGKYGSATAVIRALIESESRRY